MLSKAATMLMGIIHEQPLNAYEIVKKLQFMNIKQWYNIGDSTVYATIKSLEKKGFISGTVEKVGNMPDKTIYCLTENGQSELLTTLKQSILQFDFDTNVFSIAAFFIAIFPLSEQSNLLTKRLDILEKYLKGIEEQIQRMNNMDVPFISIANVKRVHDIVNAEITGTKNILNAIMQ